MVVALHARHRQQKVLANTMRLTAALAAGFLLPYFTWRVAYFGHLLPNTLTYIRGRPQNTRLQGL